MRARERLARVEVVTEQVSAETAPAIQWSCVSKSFGATPALVNVSLDVRPATIHAMVGENGAGKSTCLGVAAGRVGIDSGYVSIHGKALRSRAPRYAKALGVAAIYQELSIVPAMTVTENVFMGQQLTKYGVIYRSKMRRRYAEACESLGVIPRPDVACGSLSVADQQMTEIMRAVVGESRIVLFDEPTAALGEHERLRLFDLMHRLKANGKTCVLVSHNLEEVLAHADDISVFREGRLVATDQAGTWDKDRLVLSMLGPSEYNRAGPTSSLRAGTADLTVGSPLFSREILRVSRLTTRRLSQISFDVRPGEILGVAGLVGSGRSSLLRALAGLDTTSAGVLEMDGGSVSIPHSVRSAIGLGFVLLPEDRKTQGLALKMNGRDNLLMSRFPTVSTASFLRRRRVALVAQAAAESVALRSNKLGSAVETLSGGNQQKVLLARCLGASPRVLLADEPTRGIDIGAKIEVMNSLRAFAGRGGSVVMVSSDLAEVVESCDRAIVLSSGKMVAAFDCSVAPITVHQLLSAAFPDQPQGGSAGAP